MVTQAWRVAHPRRTLFVALLLLLSLTGGEAGSAVATPGEDLPIDSVPSDVSGTWTLGTGPRRPA